MRKLINTRLTLVFIAYLLQPFLLFAQYDSLEEAFRNPANEYRPVPFWHINGKLTPEGIREQITGAKEKSGFGGVAVLPINAHTQWGTGYPCPGTEPLYLSEAWFEQYSNILKVSDELGTNVILYDDIDFPSGTAGGRLEKEYPEYTRKHMELEEYIVKGPQVIHQERKEPSLLLMTVSGMNIHTKEIIDLQPFIQNNKLVWDVPAGEWRIMFFNIRYNTEQIVDFMQPEASAKVITMTYDEYGRRFNKYFGNVITKTFYDDVGYVHREETWTPAITDIFRDKYGKNPALYYPALYYDIGPETKAARVAFHDIRSELTAEGYVRQVAEWSAKNNLQSMGHPPENYSPNSPAANGDILKYYRHTQIPLMDAIFHYGRGIHGYKQISSAADRGDKPVVGAEIYGAFPADMDSLTLYRVAMEVLARGVNFIVPHGMWYNTEKDKIRIPPLISHENNLLGNLYQYSTWAARCCMMLQGGNRISDVALLWPITAIQAEMTIGIDDASPLPVANWLPEHVNHKELSDILSNSLRRDFTFIHPEDMVNGKITAGGAELILHNKENFQHYKVLIIPGGEVISAATLNAIRDYYEGGGNVIFTASLPTLSAEFGQDSKVRSVIKELFGSYPTGDSFRENKKGGYLAFIRDYSAVNLKHTMEKMKLVEDISFPTKTVDNDGPGYLNYIHKQRNGKDIFFISNSTDHPYQEEIIIRGKINPEIWDPHTGKVYPVEYRYEQQGTSTFTHIKISIPAISSCFLVSSK